MLGIISIIAWLSSIAAVYLVTRAVTADHTLEVSPEELAAGFREGQEWHEIYMKDEKVGYIHLVQTKEEEHFILTSETTLAMKVLGQKREIESRTEARLDKNFVLLSFDFQMDSGGTRFQASGKVEGTTIILELDTGGYKDRMEIPLKNPPLLPVSVKPLFLRHIRAPGETVAMNYFDPTTFKEEQIIIEYIGREKLTVMGEEVETIHLRQHVHGMELDSWVNELGEVYREQMPMNLISVRSTEEEAKWGIADSTRINKNLADITETTAVTLAEGTLPNLKQKNSISYHFSGISRQGLDLIGFRQSLKNHSEGFILTIKKESLIFKKDPDEKNFVIPKEIAQYLLPEPFIQSDAEKIKAQTIKLLGENPPKNLDTLKSLTRWVDIHVKNKVSVGIPTALTVLEDGTGDCNEHAVLLTALLRASGIPARMVVGLVELDGKFLYHAWVEAWIGEWFSCDPTQNAVGVDVSHIRLLIGGPSSQSEMYKVIGELKLLKIIETTEL